MEKIIAAGSRATHLLVGGGIAWVLEVGSVDAGGVTAAGADHRVRHREGPVLRPELLGGEREGGVAGQLPLDQLHPGAWTWAWTGRQCKLFVITLMLQKVPSEGS